MDNEQVPHQKCVPNSGVAGQLGRRTTPERVQVPSQSTAGAHSLSVGRLHGHARRGRSRCQVPLKG